MEEKAKETPKKTARNTRSKGVTDHVEMFEEEKKVKREREPKFDMMMCEEMNSPKKEVEE